MGTWKKPAELADLQRMRVLLYYRQIEDCVRAKSMWRRLINIFEKDMCISYLSKKTKSNSKAV